MGQISEGVMPENDMTQEELEERSVLMRLYKSRMSGDRYCPAQMIKPDVTRLLAAGLIEERGYGYRITEDGVKVWAEMIIGCTSKASQYPGLNELLVYQGIPMKASKQAKRGSAQAVLRALAAAGGRMTMEDFRKIKRRKKGEYHALDGLGDLMAAAYAVTDQDEVWLTVAGWEAARRLDSNYEPAPELEECVEPGCSKPRFVGGTGRIYPRCYEHHYAYDKARKERYREGKKEHENSMS